MGVSLRPSTYTEGGSLLDDVDVRVLEAAFAMFDYDGKVDVAVPALYLSLQIPDGTKTDQYFSLGDAKQFMPSVDDKSPVDGKNVISGPFLIKVGDKDGINNNTNGAKFLASLVNCGFPEDKLDGAITVLVGLEFHLKREAIKRTGLIRTGKNANRDQSIVVASKIHKMPWEPETKSVIGKGTSLAASSSASAPAGAQVVNGDIGAKALETAQEILIEAGGKLAKAKLSIDAFNKLKGTDVQLAKSVSSTLLNNDWLKSSGLTFDGATVSIG